MIRKQVEDYLRKIKIQYSQQPHVYKNFLEKMIEYKSSKIDMPDVKFRVSNLFDKQTELLNRLIIFLPLVTAPAIATAT